LEEKPSACMETARPVEGEVKAEGVGRGEGEEGEAEAKREEESESDLLCDRSFVWEIEQWEERGEVE
jgi:hypothetical protein